MLGMCCVAVGIVNLAAGGVSWKIGLVVVMAQVCVGCWNAVFRRLLVRQVAGWSDFIHVLQQLGRSEPLLCKDVP
jgi:hypothetical protein